MEQPTSSKVNNEAGIAPELSKKRVGDSEDTQSFELRKKVALPVANDWDTDLIPIKLKPKKMEGVPEPTELKVEVSGSFQFSWMSDRRNVCTLMC